MNKTRVFKLLIVLMSLFSSASYGGSIGTSNIKFTANIVTWTCTVDTTSQNITVDLGEWNTGSFGSSAIKTPPVKFSILLNNCSNTSVTTTFSGKSDSTDSDYLALDSTSTAKNIAVQILDNDKAPLPLNKASSSIAVDPSGSARLNFYAAYITTANDVQAGSADAEATFTLNYY